MYFLLLSLPLPRLGSTDYFTYQTEFKCKIFIIYVISTLYFHLAAEKSGGTGDRLTTDQHYNGACYSEVRLYIQHLMKGTVYGKRNRGRTKTTWMDGTRNLEYLPQKPRDGVDGGE